MPIEEQPKAKLTTPRILIAKTPEELAALDVSRADEATRHSISKILRDFLGREMRFDAFEAWLREAG